MNKPTRRRRAACCAAARTLATAAAMAALIATMSAGQALAGPDERVLERQGRVDSHEAAGQADEQNKAAEPSQAPSAQYPRRHLQPEPPVAYGPPLGNDEPLFPTPVPRAPDNSSRLVLAITLSIVALLLALGAATTWRLRHRHARPEPTA
jgi:hypothetical protein